MIQLVDKNRATKTCAPSMGKIDDLIQMEKLYFWSFEPFK